MHKSDFGYGPLSLDEWPGRWKMNPRDQDVSDEEFDHMYRAIASWLGQYFSMTESDSLSEFPAYCRGDNLVGDRTQIIDIRDADCFSIEFIHGLQEYLEKNGHDLWRIIIPYDEPEQGSVVIYSKCVRWGSSVEKKMHKQAVSSIGFLDG